VSVAAAREKAPRDFVPLQISLGGLQGGHSGLEIDKVRGNAIRLLERALWDVVTHYDVRLPASPEEHEEIIPREAEALLFVPAASLEDVRKELEEAERQSSGEVGSLRRTPRLVHDSRK